MFLLLCLTIHLLLKLLPLPVTPPLTLGSALTTTRATPPVPTLRQPCTTPSTFPPTLALHHFLLYHPYNFYSVTLIPPTLPPTLLPPPPPPHLTEPPTLLSLHLLPTPPILPPL